MEGTRRLCLPWGYIGRGEKELSGMKKRHTPMGRKTARSSNFKKGEQEGGRGWLTKSGLSEKHPPMEIELVDKVKKGSWGLWGGKDTGVEKLSLYMKDLSECAKKGHLKNKRD